jgi:prepilin-type N-terminal cleavage/methylation domain-containing protein
MVFAKLVKRGAKSGYTLVEVLVVVSIMGVLSAMGIAGLQRAVANARVKDAAINTAAFVERVANLANQRNEVLCLRIDPSNPQKILAIRDTIAKDCSDPKGSVDSMMLDSPNKFVSMATCGPVTLNWFGKTAQVAFKPRLGLSAAPPEGGVCIQYADRDVYGAVRKEKKRNRAIPMWKVNHDGTQDASWANWTEL